MEQRLRIPSGSIPPIISGVMTPEESTDAPAVDGSPRAANLPFGDLVALTATIGAAIYAALFTGYRRYYGSLGIRPEDVGVDSTFILVRSVGFIVLAGFFVLLLALGTLALSKARSGPWGGRETVATLLVITFGVAALFIADRHLKYAFWLLLCVLFVCTVACLGLTGYYYRSRSRRDRIASVGGSILALAVSFVFPAVMATTDAGVLADAVRHGVPTPPSEIFGLPVVDVPTQKVHATWICPDDQRPRIFSSSHDNTRTGILIGEGDGGYFIHLSDEFTSEKSILKIPKDCVMLTILYG